MSVYETKDLYLAAFLRAKSFRLRDVKRNGTREAVFVFEDRPDREALLLAYYNNEGSIEPLAYVNAWKDLKALTYNF